MPDSVWSHRQQPTRLPHPWDSPGKNTGVGCHFLFQCRKVKSESEVAQSCPTLSDPMDCSPPGSSIHGIFQARVLEWGAIAWFSLIHKSTFDLQTTCPLFQNFCITWLLASPPRSNSPRVLEILPPDLNTKSEVNEVKVTQLCPTLCDPMDYTVHGILQARTLEWVAFPFSRGSFRHRIWTRVSCIAGRFFTNWKIPSK